MSVEKLFQELEITEKEIKVLEVSLNVIIERYVDIRDKTKISQDIVDLVDDDKINLFKDKKSNELPLLLKDLKDECKKFKDEYGNPALELKRKFQPIFDLINNK